MRIAENILNKARVCGSLCTRMPKRAEFIVCSCMMAHIKLLRFVNWELDIDLMTNTEAQLLKCAYNNEWIRTFLKFIVVNEYTPGVHHDYTPIIRYLN